MKIDYTKAKKAARVLRALNNPVRQQILAYICKNPETCVGDIYRALEIDQSVTSQQLAILRDADIVSKESYGKNRHYKVNYDLIERTNNLITDFFKP